MKKNRYANQHVVAATGQNWVARSFARVSNSYALKASNPSNVLIDESEDDSNCDDTK